MNQDHVLSHAAREVCRVCLGLAPGETFLVVTDSPLSALASCFVSAGRGLGVETLLLELSPRSFPGEEPPALVGSALLEADAALLITSMSLTHTRARADATDRGVRMASMPMLTEEVMRGPLVIDYEEVGRLSEALAAKLAAASEAVLTTPAGTRLRFDLTGRSAIADTGCLTGKGAFGNLPAGEAFAAPLEGKTEGILVVDGVMAGIGPLDEPIVMKVEAGRVTDIRGGASAGELNKLLSQVDENAWSIAEFGIGTNRSATLTGTALEAEKAFGTAHVALGDNAHMGGIQFSKIHIDGVLLEPTIELDGVPIMERGRFCD